MRIAASLLAAMLLLSIAAGAGLKAELKEQIEGLRALLGERAREVEKRLASASNVTEALLIIMEEMEKMREELERGKPLPSIDDEFAAKAADEIEGVVNYLSELGVIPAEEKARAEQLSRLLRAGDTSAIAWLGAILQAQARDWNYVLAVKVALEGSEGVEKKIEALDERLRPQLYEVVKCVRPIAPMPIAPIERGALNETIRSLITRCTDFQPMPVPEDPGRISIDISLAAQGSISLDSRRVNIASSELRGEAKFSDIGVLVVPAKTSIIVKVGFSKVDGGIIVGGALVLKGEKHTYTITMPCFVATESCIRIMAIIPGYDAPLEIEPGKYSIDLEVAWDAKGRAQVVAELIVTEVPFRIRSG